MEEMNDKLAKLKLEAESHGLTVDDEVGKVEN